MAKCITVKAENLDIRCLLPIRYLGRCFECERFENSHGKRCDAAIVPREVERYLESVKLYEQQKTELDKKWSMLLEYERKRLEEKLENMGGNEK